LTFQFDGFEPEEGQELFTITKVQERLATPQEQRASIRVKSKLLDKWGDYTLKVKVSTYFEINSDINLVHKLIFLL